MDTQLTLFTARESEGSEQEQGHPTSVTLFLLKVRSLTKGDPPIEKASSWGTWVRAESPQ